MKVYVAKGSGFCWGVQRAMDMAYDYANANKEVYSLREIIHNPQEVKRLEASGARHTQSVDMIKKGSKAIISTHGVTPQEEGKLRKISSDVLDTTCPFVKKIHKIVVKLGKEGYQVAIVGDKDHWEVKGIKGYARDNCCNNVVVISSVNEAEKVKLGNKIGIVAQTTLNVDMFKELVQIMERKFLNRNSEVRVFNTICDATQKRQEATITLAKKVDIMIIIGGKNSANTKRLFSLSNEYLKDVYHVEEAKEIKKMWFKGKQRVGVSAGASTPVWVIEAAVNKIQKF